MLNKKRNNITKKNLSKVIAAKTGLSESFSSGFIDEVLLIIQDFLKINDKINVKNFGIFTAVKKKTRIGRNPKDKTSHIISERKVITFKASVAFKKKINNNLYEPN